VGLSLGFELFLGLRCGGGQGDELGFEHEGGGTGRHQKSNQRP
jgi:hypothetical protein